MDHIARIKFVPPTRFELETFRPFSSWMSTQLRQNEPDCFNGIVHIRKWRIVAEQLPEPNEILAARLLKLWKENDNGHHFGPLRAEAKVLGIELP